MNKSIKKETKKVKKEIKKEVKKADRVVTKEKHKVMKKFDPSNQRTKQVQHEAHKISNAVEQKTNVIM